MNAQVGDVFGKKLPLATVLEARTIAKLAEIIDGEAKNRERVSLVEIQPHGERPRLYFMHAAGGNVMFYRHLSQRLGADQPFYAFQSQGLDGQERMLRTIEEMAALYVRELLSVDPEGPYHLAGYCMGGNAIPETSVALSSTVSVMASPGATVPGVDGQT